MVTYERIKTTEAKAKSLKSWIDKLITLAKTDTVHHRRLAFQDLGDHNLVKKLFESIAPRFKGINGGYTRMFYLGCRKGDASRISLIELTKLEIKEKRVREKKEKETENVEVEQRGVKRAPQKEKPRKTIIDGVKGIFKKERDSL